MQGLLDEKKLLLMAGTREGPIKRHLHSDYISHTIALHT